MGKYQKALYSLLQGAAQDMHPTYGGGLLSPSEYDTAWLLRLRDKNDPQQLRYPQALEWLLNNQHVDGSWSQPYPHNIIPTLSVVCAFLSLPDKQKRQVSCALGQGLDFLSETLSTWRAANHESAGLELLLPGYLAELAKHGFFYEAQDQSVIVAQKRQKLMRSARPEYLLRGMPLVHSIEALTGVVDHDLLKSLRRPEGNVGNSVSATVSWILATGEDERANAWLNHVTSQFGGLAPVAYPIDILELAWVLLMLHPISSQIDRALLEPLLPRLEHALAPEGAAWCLNSAIAPDGDDTSAALTVLGLYDHPREPKQLLKFENEEAMTSWIDERTSSVSTNAHAMEAALMNSGYEYSARIVDKTSRYLLKHRADDGGYYDKWHLSRIYPAHCAIMAFSRHSDCAIRAEQVPAAQWLMNKQHADGSWGDWIPSAEETALAVLALCHAREFLDVIEPIQRGKRWLDEHYSDPRPQQNIGKQLFLPHRIVEAEVLSALLIQL